MRIENILVENIKPASYNPRKDLRPGDPAYDRLRKVVGRFGLVEPLVWNMRTGNLVGGHQRFKILMESRPETVECSVVDLDDLEEKALNVALNKHSGEWDFSALADLVKQFDVGKIDTDITGFSGDEISKMIDWINAPPKAETEYSGADEPQEKDILPPKRAITKPGQVWALGEHRLICGDSRDPAVFATLFGESRVNVAITSPPYASQRDYDNSSGFVPIPPDKYVDWYEPIARNIAKVLDPAGSYFLNIKPAAEGIDTHLYCFDLVLAHARAWGFHFGSEFCWERNGVPKSVTQRFKNQFEPIYQFALGRWKMRPDAVRHRSLDVPTAGGKGSGNTTWSKAQGAGKDAIQTTFGGARKTSYDGFIGQGLAYPGNRLPTFSGTHEAFAHAAAFPVGLAQFFVMAYSDKADVIFDPFMGSGSTLIAAEKTDRRGFGIEISAGYCDVIVERWQTFSGLKAKRT